ncbi:FecR protein [Dyadobacter jejuensis]|uniref:FecR protein n=1 Tax=Dyadobacter jejuensis TaxID=1082580 RepID=A0A316AMF6_9BACT|nr:FecR family protein [Dyadobacter jejuensis]PWJ58722.1 FecR protein [Dyadobacter jejuensis]
MDHYNQYTVEELVWDVSFRNWVLSPTREDHQLWEGWLLDHPEKREVVRQARTMVLHITPDEGSLSPFEKRQAIKNIISSVGQESGNQPAANPHKIYPRIAMAVAACLVLGFGILWAYNLHQRPVGIDYQALVSQAAKPLLERQNASDTAISIRLADGSRVELQPKSKISYPRQFDGGKREVFLSGEAFFEISKDASRPFYVYANEVVTKVLGTSFVVRSFSEEQEVSVRVKTGRVAVFAHNDPEDGNAEDANRLSGTILDPNQQIIVERKSVKMVKSLIPIPEMVHLPEETPVFDFDEIPVKDVFAIISSAYGVEIITDRTVSYDCPLSANLSGMSLFEKVDLVCRAIGVRYESIDGKIIIEGKGCK